MQGSRKIKRSTGIPVEAGAAGRHKYSTSGSTSSLVSNVIVCKDGKSPYWVGLVAFKLQCKENVCAGKRLHTLR